MTKEVSTSKAPVSTRGEFANISLQGSMGIASSPLTDARPTVEEVIAFGGISRPSGVRTSKRLGSQANVDMPQMEKAMMNAQLRDVSACAGYPYDGTLGSVVGSTVTGGTAGCYGYWMHTAPDGRSGYLVPGWLVAQ
ncbi:uncharacterized protein LOC124698622 [Lolium rigidum]|uniref:uncharacterized protein LOC124698622 n=1 Tax=Lolium rigidum TaxID=89674 RepID=UPI001F5CD7E2|nr:uncharacterized protein LOC124698622 [Lolium rigidum]